uniref:Gonadal protein gdl n=1 Tax=Syphacia muris TaxID=451379 RepID=A0A0N5AK41_9BILA
MDKYSVEDRRIILQQEMQSFIGSVNAKVKSEFTEELKNSLIESLLDGTVFAIVDSLKDLQRMRETQLYDNRQQRLVELQTVPDLEEQMRLIDVNIVRELDKIVAEQQNTLSRAGVPNFHTTKDENEIVLQMEIIRFIMTVINKHM